MTLPRRWQLSQSRWLVSTFRERSARCCFCVLPVVCAVGCLAACSASAAAVHLPRRMSVADPGTHAARARPLTPRQRVAAALAGYTSALTQAEDSRSAATASRLLRPYLASGRIAGMVSAISAVWHRGDVFYGQDVLHVLSVRIEGRRAYVHDCDDTSGMGLALAASGQTVPGTAGVAHANLVTRLVEVDGRWLVASQLPEDLPCAG